MFFHARGFPGSHVSGAVAGERMYADPSLFHDVLDTMPFLHTAQSEKSASAHSRFLSHHFLTFSIFHTKSFPTNPSMSSAVSSSTAIPHARSPAHTSLSSRATNVMNRPIRSRVSKCVSVTRLPMYFILRDGVSESAVWFKINGVTRGNRFLSSRDSSKGR